MRNITRFSTLVLISAVALSLATGPTCAQDEIPEEDGFVSLFNGEDLTGWEGDERLWSVVDGAIRGQTTEENVARGNTFLIWRGGTLKNFILKIKFRVENGNSGIQYRSKDLGNHVVGGYQAEVCNEQPQVGFLYHERGRASLARVGEFVIIDEEGNKEVFSSVGDARALQEAGYYKPREWNEYVIYARGNHIIQVLNGYQTIELIDNDLENRLMEGILALQIHSGPPMVVEFKDIALKTIDDEFGEAFVLFNGKDLDDWALSSDALNDTFGVENGVMTNTGQPAGYIRTKEDYASYALTLQLKHLRAGNNGVLLRMVGPDKVWPRSIEAQGQKDAMGDIWNIDQFPMKVAEDRTSGRHTRKMYPSNEFPVGEWNRYDIHLSGGDLALRVNDLVQNIATECWEVAGKICLQAEGVPVEYRNIVLVPILRDLPEEENPLGENDVVLEGTVFGSGEVFGGQDAAGYQAAFDGDINSYADLVGENLYVGLDLGEAQPVHRIRYYPRAGWTQRMVGGRFQGSNASATSGYVDLHTITAEPGLDWVSVPLADATAYRYLRYLSPEEGHANVAAIQFISQKAQTPEALEADGWISLFNGKDLTGWTPKFSGFDLGENYRNTFRVEDGVLKATYEEWDRFNGEFGHLFYKDEFSYYRLRLEYRFVGDQVAGGPGWAFRNNGIMIHGQRPETMAKGQDFPVSIEVQLLGGGETGNRPTANLCSPGTHVVMNGNLTTAHCVESNSKTFRGDQWVTVELEVRGDEVIRHFVNGEKVMEYSETQYDPGDATARPLIEKADGELALTGGTISLQAESHTTEFRNIYIKPLTD